MLTVNVALQDRLVNGQLGTVKYIVLNSQNNVSKINTDNFARQHLWVPIKKTTVDIRIK